MGKPLQRDRIYSLKIGDAEDAIEINQLQIKFESIKTNDNTNKKNSSWVEITNLSDSRRKKLQHSNIVVSLDVGYADTGLYRLFTGQSFNIGDKNLVGWRDKRQATDIVTRIDVDELFTDLNYNNLSEFAPANSTIREVITRVASSMEGVSRKVLTGETINQRLIDGYQIQGSPRSMLDKLSKSYHLQWYIDNGSLYVSDVNDSHIKSNNDAYVLSQDSGLIGAPEFINETAKRNRKVVRNKKNTEIKEKPNGIQIVCLLNPSIVAGGVVKLEFDELTGFYIVDEVKHDGDFRGSRWYSTLRCTERIG